MGKGNAKLPRIKSQTMWPYIFAAPYILCFLLFSLFPTGYSLVISFFDWNGIGKMEFVGFTNYISILTNDPLFWKAVWNTLAIILIAIPCEIFFGLLLANSVFALGKTKRLFETVFFLPYIVAPIAMGAIFYYVFDWQYGYLNDILVNLGVISDKIPWLFDGGFSKFILIFIEIWRHMGYCMVIYMAGMTSIPVEIYDAAKIDGAGRRQTFMFITVPQLHNVTVFLVLTSMVNGMQLFEVPMKLYNAQMITSALGGPNYTALTVIWKFIDDAFGSGMRLSYGAALGYILFVIIVLASLIVRKISFLGEDKKYE